ncbi:putative aspartate carbamoyltransferase [Acinetobacter sp. ATCC 27244]|nr:putative aspartate carbamoyltransferase [Acinetobacter sp. ATCC 27244]
MHIAALHQPSQVQLNQQGNLKHFLTIEGLSKESLTKILDTAQSFLDENNNLINRPLLEGLTVMNLFLKTLLVLALHLKQQRNAYLPMS